MAAKNASRTSEMAKAKCSGKPMPQFKTGVAANKLEKQLQKISKLEAANKENSK